MISTRNVLSIQTIKKLCMLNRKINADFLQATKSPINLELAITAVNLSYDDALAAFRDQLNQKHPLWAAAEELVFKADAEVIKVEEADVAAKEDFMVDVDKEDNMAEEAGKTWDINSPYPILEWYSVTMKRR